MSIFYFIIWFFCGVIAAVCASNKGRNAGAWFAIGVLLGPIGVVLSLVISKDDEIVEQKSIKSGESKKCKYCAELIKRDAVICKHCSRDQKVDVDGIVTALTGKEGSSESAHKLLQTAIYERDLQTVKKIVASGLLISDSALPFSHIDYANLHGDNEIIKEIEKAL